MSLLSVVATFECDECGAQFTASVDESYEPAARLSIFDVAVDAIRGGIWESVEDDKHLCRACTKKADIAAEMPEEEMPEESNREGVPPGYDPNREEGQ